MICWCAGILRSSFAGGRRLQSMASVDSITPQGKHTLQSLNKG